MFILGCKNKHFHAGLQNFKNKILEPSLSWNTLSIHFSRAASLYLHISNWPCQRCWQLCLLKDKHLKHIFVFSLTLNLKKSHLPTPQKEPQIIHHTNPTTHNKVRILVFPPLPSYASKLVWSVPESRIVNFNWNILWIFKVKDLTNHASVTNGGEGKEGKNKFEWIWWINTLK